jgi:hypothetical protein
VCTRCAWELGWSEASVLSGAEEAYGPFASGLQERVASCADYLGRITGQLAGRPSRHYVTEKAQELRDAASRLVRTCHDVEGWLSACGATIRCEHDGEVCSSECALTTGHEGEHDANPRRSPVEVARDSAEDLADLAVGVADTLGWLSHYLQRLADRDEVEDFWRQQRELRRSVERLAALRPVPTRREGP